MQCAHMYIVFFYSTHMKHPTKNNQTFLTQLRKSHAAFTARVNDFTDFPVDLDVYDRTIDEFETAVTADMRYETETLAAYLAAKETYRAAVAAARATFSSARDATEIERTQTRDAMKMTRSKAEELFLRYQNIAEAVYLGSRRVDVLAEFEMPTKTYASRTTKVTTTETPVV